MELDRFLVELDYEGRAGIQEKVVLKIVGNTIDSVIAGSIDLQSKNNGQLDKFKSGKRFVITISEEE